MALYFLILSTINPNVVKLTFSFVDKILKSRSFSSASIHSPMLLLIISFILSISFCSLIPRSFPFLLITKTLDPRISPSTLQISLKTNFPSLLLCNNLLIFLVLSNNCTLMSRSPIHYPFPFLSLPHIRNLDLHIRPCFLFLPYSCRTPGISERKASAKT